MGGDWFFWIFFAFFFLVLFISLGYLTVMLVRSLGQWRKNKQSPRLTVEATAVSKRMDRTQYGRSRGDSIGHTTTIYYATFQVESGDRLELSMLGAEYGMLAEGDHGKLSFQGSRYLGFQRN